MATAEWQSEMGSASSDRRSGCISGGENRRASAERSASYEESSGEHAQGALPQGFGGSRSTSRARWYSSAVISPDANRRPTMSSGDSAWG